MRRGRGDEEGPSGSEPAPRSSTALVEILDVVEAESSVLGAGVQVVKVVLYGGGVRAARGQVLFGQDGHLSGLLDVVQTAPVDVPLLSRPAITSGEPIREVVDAVLGVALQLIAIIVESIIPMPTTLEP